MAISKVGPVEVEVIVLVLVLIIVLVVVQEVVGIQGIHGIMARRLVVVVVAVQEEVILMVLLLITMVVVVVLEVVVLGVVLVHLVHLVKMFSHVHFLLLQNRILVPGEVELLRVVVLVQMVVVESSS